MLCPLLNMVADSEYSSLRFASSALARAALAGKASSSLSMLFVAFSAGALSSLSSAISFSRSCLSEEEDDGFEPLVSSIVLSPSADSDNSSVEVKEKTVS